MKLPTQLFVLDRRLFEATSWEEVFATCRALAQCELLDLPFPVVTLRVPSDCLPISGPHTDEYITEWNERPKYPDAVTRGRYIYFEQKLDDAFFFEIPNLRWRQDNKGFECDTVKLGLGVKLKPTPWDMRAKNDDHDRIRDFCTNYMAFFLVAVLSTRNVEKRVEHNKLAKLGIGTKKNPLKRFDYVTTLTVPNCVTERDEEHCKTGREITPHLRRAHVRQQRHGPNRQFVKPVLIPAVFVNADKEWVRVRSAYNTGMGQ